MLNLLLQPYPLWDNKPRKFFVIAAIAVFVFLFLYVFKPFGLQNIKDSTDALIFAGYGIVSFVILILLQFLIPAFLPAVFNEDFWNVYKEILFILITLFFIGIGNMLYTTWLGFIHVSKETFLYFEMVTIMVAIFPVTLSVLIKQNYLLRKNLKQSSRLSEKLYRKSRLVQWGDTLVQLSSENPKDSISADSKDIYYVAAADNYIEVYYRLNNTMKKVLLRSTLKNAHASLKRFSNFYRCHRTYIVNLDKVKSVTGNSQGYKLILFDTEELIPVSRTLTREVTQRLSI